MVQGYFALKIPLARLIFKSHCFNVTVLYIRTKSFMKLVSVESPTKAKAIKKFLGPDYQVESCMGHIRDLPQSAKDIPEKYKKEEWSRLGVDVEHGFEPIYCIPKTKTKVVRELKNLLKDADELIL